MKHSEIQTKAPRVLKWRRWKVRLKFWLRDLAEAVEADAQRRLRHRESMRKLKESGLIG
jgi:hypothetical protein